jgi:hypothetical protein
MAKRIEEVFELRLGGAELQDVREYAQATVDDEGKPREPWNVSEGQLCRYIAAADKLCRERFDARAEHLLARHLLQRRRLYAHVMEVGDFRTALAVMKDEAELEGLYVHALDRLQALEKQVETILAGDRQQILETILADLPPQLAERVRAALGRRSREAGESAEGGDALGPQRAGGDEEAGQPGDGKGDDLAENKAPPAEDLAAGI